MPPMPAFNRVVLTDGDEWRLYNSQASVPFEEKLFRKVGISGEPSETEKTLDLLSKDRMKEDTLAREWRRYYVDRKVQGAIEKLFALGDPAASLIRLITREVGSLPRGEIKASLSRVRVHPDFPVEPGPKKPLTAADRAWVTRREGRRPPHKPPFRPGTLKALALDALRERPEGLTPAQIEEAVLKGNPEVAKRFKRTSVASQTWWMIREASERGIALEITTTADGEKLYRIKSEATPRVAVEPGSLPAGPSPEGRQKRGDVSVKELIGAGHIPPPLELEKTYKGNRITARVEADGKVTCSGKSYDTLSMAALAACQAIMGGRKLHSINGWTFWQFRDDNGQLAPVAALRQRYLKGRKAASS